MRKMKDSGVEWIGEIPEGWRIQRLKFAVESHFGGVWGKAQGEDEIDSICVRVADFNYPLLSVNFNDEMTVRAYKSSVFKECSIKYGDILLEKSGGGEVTPVGRSVAFESKSDMMCANFIECLRPKKQQNYRFLNYWLSCAYHNGLSKRNIKQTTGIQNLDITTFFNEKAIVVPLDEQIRIVDYIDNRCAEIDKVIKAKETTNEKLKEYRQSIIYEAVTKGLDKNSKMKDSGIEWIGEIPKGWRISKIKFLLLESSNSMRIGPYGSSLSGSVIQQEGNYKVYGQENLIADNFSIGEKYISNNKYEELNAYTLRPGDITISMMGTIGKCSIVPSQIEPGIMDSHLIRIRFNSSKIVSTFFKYSFSSDSSIKQLYYYSQGSIMNGLNSSIIKSISIALPSIGVQIKIVNYLDRKCAEIDSVISSNEKTIDKLKEYRQSIIYEAVTGKVEVM